jgi:hypothetical protein
MALACFRRWQLGNVSDVESMTLRSCRSTMWRAGGMGRGDSAKSEAVYGVLGFRTSARARKQDGEVR